ncbi:hypothetical protein LIT38_14320 [Bacillus sp. CMF12]|uniref:hypothetical protein n=1 Tax=Bacillus sp. CMF12 TaxID=2884834 RepID=UPI00207A0F5B|nr:hypothetical protein [Bacillus sp. CMF12]USK47786.1 hypothetical protein LIT38_14320 [Bacillus sp. CMF12]
MEYFTSWAWLKGFLIIENADDGIFAWFGFLEVIIAEWGLHEDQSRWAGRKIVFIEGFMKPVICGVQRIRSPWRAHEAQNGWSAEEMVAMEGS